MENSIQKLWYQTFDWSMIWACAGGLLCVIVFQIVQSKNIKNSQSAISDYFTLTWPNILFQIIAGYLMLAIVPEIGIPLFRIFTKVIGAEIEVDSVENIAHTLAAICGLFGGYFLAKIINKVQKN